MSPLVVEFDVHDDSSSSLVEVEVGLSRFIFKIYYLLSDLDETVFFLNVCVTMMSGVCVCEQQQCKEGL